MKLALLNRQRIKPLRRTALLDLARFLADRAFPDPARRPAEITLLFLDHAHIRPVKARYWNQSVTTDVIAFTYDAPPPAPPGAHTGDILINVQLALEVGPRHGGVDRELALYMAHGFDHLAGADDADPRQQRRMRRRELAWLRQARAAGKLGALLLSRRRSRPA